MQLANALLPILVAFGKLIDVNAVQLANALLPILVAFGQLISLISLNTLSLSGDMSLQTKTPLAPLPPPPVILLKKYSSLVIGVGV